MIMIFQLSNEFLLLFKLCQISARAATKMENTLVGPIVVDVDGGYVPIITGVSPC